MRPTENRFFRYVWRFNALALAAVATSFIFVLALYAIDITGIFRKETHGREVANVVRAGENQTIPEQFFLDEPDSIEGTSYVRVPLHLGQAYHGWYSGGRIDRAVNYLFLNIATNESRWLFERAGQMILQSHKLFSKLKNTPDESRNVVGFLHIVIDKDSNGDNRLSVKDTVSLAASAVDGTNYRKLIEGIENLYSVRQITDDKVLVLYQKGQQTVSELFNVSDLRPLMQANIPKVDFTDIDRGLLGSN